MLEGRVGVWCRQHAWSPLQADLSSVESRVDGADAGLWSVDQCARLVLDICEGSIGSREDRRLGAPPQAHSRGLFL